MTTTTNMHTTIEHAEILTSVVLRTMARGTQKQATKGSLSSDNHGSIMVRELRANLARDKQTLARYTAMDNGTTIQHDDDTFQDIEYSGNCLGVDYSMRVSDYKPRAISDSMDIVNEAVLAICEVMPNVNHDEPYELTDDALKAVYRAINKYVYSQKSRPATKHAYIEAMAKNVDETNAPNDYIAVLQYLDIATTQDYDGYMIAYRRLLENCTSVQRQVLRYLAKGYSQKKIAAKIYGDNSQTHCVRVNYHVKQIRAITCRIFTDSWQVKHYSQYAVK